MANSSDWLAEVDDPSGEPGKSLPAWLARLQEPAGFVERSPFAPKEEPVSDLPSGEEADISGDAREEQDADPIAEAWAEGEESGRAAAKAEHETRNEQHERLTLAFRSLDQAAQSSFAAELAETVIALCDGAIAGLQIDAKSLEKRCQQAAKRLGAAADECALHLNPHDIDQLDPSVRERWTVVADDKIERGGLRFEGTDGSISDTPEDWRHAIAAAVRG